MRHFSKKTKIIVGLLLIVVVVVAWKYFNGNQSKGPEYVAVKRSNLVQTVSSTGRVKPAEDVNLAFEKNGQINNVYVQVGDRVKIGQALVGLKNSDALAQLSQAEANLASTKAQLNQYQAALEMQQFKLDELKRGTRSEELQIQEIKVANAKTSLRDAQQNLVDKLQDAYTKSDDAIRNKVDQIFDNPRSSNPRVSFFMVDSQLENILEQKRVETEDILNKWKASLNGLTVDDNLAVFSNEGNKNLEQVKSFLDKVGLAVNGTLPSASLSQTTIDLWKSDVGTARTNVNTAIVNLTAAAEKLETAKSGLTLAEQDLVLAKAGNTVEEIDAQKAQVRQSQANVVSQAARVKEAEANLQYYNVQLAKNTMRAPINGVVTKQDAKVGEMVLADKILVSLISETKFEIESNVPEADIAKVKVGNQADVTLDAYGSDIVFKTQVASIDPAENIIDGVATYKITLQFLAEDSRVKSGMTANLDIMTDKRENVLTVSQRLIFGKGNEKFVKVLVNGLEEERKVSVGLKGSDGNVEILTGLAEGDKVITP